MAEETTPTLKPFADFDIEDSRSVQVWRYVDFPKLASLLQTKRLVFPTVDRIASGDPWEGALGVKNLEEVQTRIGRADSQTGRDEIISGVQQAARRLRSRYAVSCWHMNDAESVAMWQLYAARGSGIAIQTTVGQLVDALQVEDNKYAARSWFGEVTYRDYDRVRIDETPPAPLFSKRRELEHEREFRLVLEVSEEAVSELEIARKIAAPGWDVFITGDMAVSTETPLSMILDPELTIAGMVVPLSLERLDARVVLAPSTESWVMDTVRRLLKSADVQWSVDRSKHDQPPPHTLRDASEAWGVPGIEDEWEEPTLDDQSA